MQTIYISSEAKHAVRWRVLRDDGAPISATWIDNIEAEIFGDTNLSQRRIDEVIFADRVVIYCESGKIPADSMIEAGAALTAGRRVICVGKPSNPPRAFVSHPLWSEAATIEDALQMPQPEETGSSEWLAAEARKEMQRFVEETDRLIKTGEANDVLPPDSPEEMAAGMESHAETLLRLSRFQEAVLKRANARLLRHIEEFDDENAQDVSLSLTGVAGDAVKVLMALAQRIPLASGSVRLEVEEIIEGFYRLAATGNSQALKDLSIVAVESTQRLKRLAIRMPEAVSEIAQTRPNWPALIGPHGDTKKANEELVGILRVGAKCPLNVNGGWSNRPSAGQEFRDVIGKYVQRMVEVISGARNPGILAHFDWCPAPPDWVKEARELPDLTDPQENIVEAWFGLGWKILCSFSEGQPELLPELARVGEFRAGTWKRMEATLGQQTNQLRMGLRERLHDAFMKRYIPRS